MPRKTAAQLAAEAATPVEHPTLLAAKLAVQAALPTFQKDKVNPHFGSAYLSLESLMPQVLDILTANGLVLTQMGSYLEFSGAPALRTRLTHVISGEFEEDRLPLSAGKDTPQGQGSALTYARRYALMAALNIVADKDDDGNAGSRGTAPTTAPVAAAAAIDAPLAAPVSGDPFGGAL